MLKCTVCLWVAAFFLQGCGQQSNNIRIKGSDTEVNLTVLLAEDFHKLNPDVPVSVSGGGSGLGIAALINGHADIANSSRELSPYEDSLMRSRGVNVKTFVFAQDAIAVVVHEQFPLDGLSLPQLADILSGKEKNWRAFTGSDVPINIYGRQSNSGTYEFIREKLGIQFSPYAKEMNGNAQIMESIKRDPSGIGYVGAGYVSLPEQRAGIKVLQLSGETQGPAYSPLDADAVNNKQYVLQRPLYQFIPARSVEVAMPFIRYEQSKRAKAIIESSGYYAATTPTTWP